MTGRAPDDLRDSLAIAAALVNRPALQVERAPEEALWLLGSNAAISHQPSAMSSGALRDTGYYVSRAGGSHLVIDGGPHGYQNGGHAHADALSLTWAVNGAPLLIDPGTACYTTDAAMRDRMRSTALHNTLTLDNRSQSLPRGPFHWSHVANGQVHRWRTDQGFDYFDGSHDGYRPIEHRRRVLAIHGDLIVVADFVAEPTPTRQPCTGTSIRGGRSSSARMARRSLSPAAVHSRGLLGPAGWSTLSAATMRPAWAGARRRTAGSIARRPCG